MRDDVVIRVLAVYGLDKTAGVVDAFKRYAAPAALAAGLYSGAGQVAGSRPARDAYHQSWFKDVILDHLKAPRPDVSFSAAKAKFPRSLVPDPRVF